MIVSRADVVSLAGQISDQLPVETAIQEFQLNDGPVLQRKLELPQASAEVELRWNWDLLNEFGDGTDEATPKLSGGDIIRTAIVAVDRKGQRGESAKIELLITDEGFSPRRYLRMDQLDQLTQNIIGWTTRTDQLMSTYSKLLPSDLTAIAAAENELSLNPDVHSQLPVLIETASTPAAAGRLELIGTAIEDLDRKIGEWITEMRQLISNESVDQNQHPASIMDRLRTEALGFSRQARNIEIYVRCHLSHLLSLQLIEDCSGLLRSLRRLQESDIPVQQLSRHLRIVDRQLIAIDEAFSKYRDAVTDSSRQLSDNWSEWRVDRSEQIGRAIDQAVSIDQLKSIIAQLVSDLISYRSDKAIYNRQSSIGLVNGLRTLQSQIEGVPEQVRLFATQFDSRPDRLLQSLDDARALHQVHPAADLTFIADIGLMRSALQNVTNPDFVSGVEESIQQSLGNLADAFQILQAGHELTMWQNELTALLAAETNPSGEAVRRFEHPQLLDRYVAGITWTLASLKNSKLAQPVDSIDHSITHPSIARANQLLGERRFDGDKLTSARLALRPVQRELAEYLNRLQPPIEVARNTIRRYVLPLHQLARQAAQQVQQTIRATRPDAPDGELKKEHAEADAATEQTMQSLMDIANTLSTADEQSRELARDADAALAQISQQRNQVNQAMKAETTEPLAGELEQLRRQLVQTADHFERAERGEDVSASRAELRNLEKELNIDQTLDERFQQAEALAEAAQRDAGELRKQLEREATQNQPMRNELSEIAQRTAESALQSLKQSSDDERSLNQALERADPDFLEQKIRLAERLSNLAQELSTLYEAYGNAISNAAKETALGDQAGSLQQELRDAAATTRGLIPNASQHSSIIDAAKQIAIDLLAATESINQFNELTSSAETNEPDADQVAENNRNAERWMRQFRDQRFRAASEQIQRSTAAKQNATRRAQQAKQQLRSYEQSKQQLQNTSQQDPGNESVTQQLAGIQQRIDQARRAEQAAEESVNQADKQLNDVKQKADGLRQQRVDPIESKAPAVEALQRLSQQLGSQLDPIRDALGEIAGAANLPEDLELPQFEARRLTAEQVRIRDEIDEIGNELRRAALNEQRVGQDDSARKLADSATRVKKVAALPASDAANELARTEADPTAAPEAVRQIQRTMQEIDREVAELTKLLGGASAESSDNKGQSSEDESQRGKQLARTLDELEQSNAQQGQQESNQTAGQASPTLNSAVQQSARDAAKQRREQISPGGSEARDPSQETSSSLAGNDAAVQSGEGTMSDGGPVSIDGIDRSGADWGQLRVRRSGDASETLRSEVPAKYRRQIEAYFRAIAQQAAQGGGP